MNKLIFLSILMMALGCSQPDQEACIDEAKINPDKICTMEYKPVCGCNGKTYGNKCEAEAAGLTSWTDGTCPEKP